MLDRILIRVVKKNFENTARLKQPYCRKAIAQQNYADEKKLLKSRRICYHSG